MVKTLLSLGANIYIKNDNGVSPLNMIEELAKTNDKYVKILEIIHMENLPPDIMDQTLLYTPPEKILLLCQISQTFNERYCENSDHPIWKILYVRDVSKTLPIGVNIKEQYF